MPGVEPGSEMANRQVSTCVVSVLNLAEWFAD